MKTLYESILDIDQETTMNRMEDDLIRRQILEYCTYRSSGVHWPAADKYLEIVKIDKDSKGWYIDTKSHGIVGVADGRDWDGSTSFLDCCNSRIPKSEHLKDIAVMDESGFTGMHFRWRKHEGDLSIIYMNDLRSTEGLPEEMDLLRLVDCKIPTGKKFEIRNNIKVIVLVGIPTIDIIGRGCKHIVVDPDWKPANQQDNPYIVPAGTKLHNPDKRDDYIKLLKKLRVR